MKVRRVWAVARKEFLHILRDPRSLGMGIAIPILLLVIYGYALTMDVDEVPLVSGTRAKHRRAASSSPDLPHRGTSLGRGTCAITRSSNGQLIPGRRWRPW